jgi:ribA/ribD-fused uncharacterized protein|tara:strand:- start:293 stop:955 length:663 start_codon:yes stop_codon:yes gene_type:complete
MKNIYHYEQSITFRKTKEDFGGLSNMAAGFELSINNKSIRTSEAIYQACRFPHLPEIQEKIIEQKSPMAAKMVGKPYRKDTRDDWNDVRVDIMGWCIRAKMAQNFIKFGTLLEKTINKKIVEDSHKDDFWGAISDNNSKTLTGENFLGRLLMKVRKIYFSDRKYTLLKVEPLKIPNFNLYSDPISQIDSRKQFCEEIMRISDEKKEVFPKGKSQFGLWDE